MTYWDQWFVWFLYSSAWVVYVQFNSPDSSVVDWFQYIFFLFFSVDILPLYSYIYIVQTLYHAIIYKEFLNLEASFFIQT